jgi:hypothetical protein
MTHNRQNFDSFLAILDGAEAVATTYADDDDFVIVSAWNGGSIVNTAGVYLTADGRFEVTGFDAWTNYGLNGLDPREVVSRMNEAAVGELEAMAAEDAQ